MGSNQWIFPVGFHRLHRLKILNFQLNRWHSLGFLSLAEVRQAAGQIRGYADWKPVMRAAAEANRRNGNLAAAAFFYRGAEFFTEPQDPDKEPYYDSFRELFYEAYAEERIERHSVPYENASLPAFRLSPISGRKTGVILMHGGFDSFIEEFYGLARFFGERGYEVVAFEGPGQGAALYKSGLALDYRWEKPTAAVLDHFRLKDVTLLGISMGGWLCFRAAAHEKRIARVAALSIAYDYLQIPPKPLQGMHTWAFKRRGLMNYLTNLKMRVNPNLRWVVNQLMHITRTETPMDAAARVLDLNERNLNSELVDQDVLILTGEKDHFIPLKMHHLQVRALTRARSVTDYIFGARDQAQNHCMIGNIGLACRTIADWLARFTNDDQSSGQAREPREG